MKHYDANELFVCSCSNLSHCLVVSLSDFNDGEPEKSWWPAEDAVDLCFQVHLNNYLGFFRRLRLAIRYIFGYNGKYGAWDVVSFRLDDVERMRGILDKYENKINFYKEQMK